MNSLHIVQWSKNTVAVLKNNLLEMWKDNVSLVVSLPLPPAQTLLNGGGSSENKIRNDNTFIAIAWLLKQLRGLMSVLLLKPFRLCTKTKRCTLSWTVCFLLERTYTNVTSVWKRIMA